MPLSLHLQKHQGANVAILEDLLCIELIQKIHEGMENLKQIIIASHKEGRDIIVRGNVTNIKFYPAMMVSVKLVEAKEDISNKLTRMRAIAISDEKSLSRCFSILQIIFLFFSKKNNLSQGTYTPQGGTELSPGFLSIYRG